MKVSKRDTRLGSYLIDSGALTEEELEQALNDRKQRGLSAQPIGRFLVESGFVKEDDVLEALARQFNLPLMDLDMVEVKAEILEDVPEDACRRLGMMPLFAVGNEFTVAVSDPTQIEAIDMIGRFLGGPVQPVLASKEQVNRMIEASFGKREVSDEDDQEDFSSLVRLDAAAGDDVSLETLKRAGEEAPIIKVVDKVLKLSVQEGASDIHIEPGEDQLLVRFRIDGVLNKRFAFAMRIAAAVVSRVKILSNLDISERQRPQDGRIQLKMGEQELEFRVSVLPVYYGEKIVMRILDRSSVKVGLGDLGMSKNNMTVFESMIKKPNGIVLVTGPTGSGKSTTLYAALNSINSIETNIVTVEDPVEYQIPLINQVGVNPKRGLTFAGALRSFLRQDPDVIMVGEIRDPETGSIAAEAALTGHLVLSTLHTNDAVSTVTRLMEMGIPPFLLAPTILCILAQRLVRKICINCKEQYEPASSELEEAGLVDVASKVTFHRGRGCPLCGNTGFKGRTGIHEVLRVDSEIRELILEKAGTGEIRRAAMDKGFRDLRFDALKKVVSGVTTISEALRVTMSTDD